MISNVMIQDFTRFYYSTSACSVRTSARWPGAACRRWQEALRQHSAPPHICTPQPHAATCSHYFTLDHTIAANGCNWSCRDTTKINQIRQSHAVYSDLVCVWREMAFLLAGSICFHHAYWCCSLLDATWCNYFNRHESHTTGMGCPQMPPEPLQ